MQQSIPECGRDVAAQPDVEGEPPASAVLGRFVASPGSALTPATTMLVRQSLLDTFAVTVAAGRHPDAAVFTATARQTYGDCPGPATGWAHQDRWPVAGAAFVNGSHSHILDYDDASSGMRLHPSAVMLPALMALAEDAENTLREVADAYVVGFEVMSALSLAVAGEHYRQGWHATTTIGALGATSACCRLLRLSASQTASAIGLMMGSLGGNRENFGSLGKPYQVGMACAASVGAARAAQLGLDASPASLDGQVGGFARLYSDGDVESLRQALLGLGRHSSLEAQPPTIKRYPSCYVTHRGIDAALNVRASHRITPEDVREVRILVNAKGLTPLRADRPTTGLQAKFNMAYAVAAALTDGVVDLLTFEDEAVASGIYADLSSRIVAVEDDGPEFPRWAQLRVTLGDGSIAESRVDALPGEGTPFSEADLRSKLQDCLAYSSLKTDPDGPLRAAVEEWDAPVSAFLSAWR